MAEQEKCPTCGGERDKPRRDWTHVPGEREYEVYQTAFGAVGWFVQLPISTQHDIADKLGLPFKYNHDGWKDFLKAVIEAGKWEALEAFAGPPCTDPFHTAPQTKQQEVTAVSRDEGLLAICRGCQTLIGVSTSLLIRDEQGKEWPWHQECYKSQSKSPEPFHVSAEEETDWALVVARKLHTRSCDYGKISGEPWPETCDACETVLADEADVIRAGAEKQISTLHDVALGQVKSAVERAESAERSLELLQQAAQPILDKLIRPTRRETDLITLSEIVALKEALKER